jgi:hypothetical protein
VRRRDKSGLFIAVLIFIAIGAMDTDAGASRETGVGEAGSGAMIDHIIGGVIIYGVSGSGGTCAGTTRTEDAVIGGVMTGDSIIEINVIGGLDRICGSRGSIRQFDKEGGLSDDGRGR